MPSPLLDAAATPPPQRRKLGSRRDRATSLVVVTALFAIVRCSADQLPPRGGLVVVIANDGTLGLDVLKTKVTSGGRVLNQNAYAIPNEKALPNTLSIVSNGSATSTVAVEISAWAKGVPVDIRDAIITQIPTDRVVRLNVSLSASCTPFVKVGADAESAESTCAEGKTCDPAIKDCASAEVNASELPTYQEGDASIPDDAGPVESGLPIESGSEDVGSGDANLGTDAADAGPVESTVTPTTIDFGMTNCGTSAAGQSLTITNPTSVDAVWSTAFGKGAATPYTLSLDSGTVAPNSSVIISVLPKSIPTNSTTSANAFGDQLTVTVSGKATSVDLRETAAGAAFVTPPSVNFGNVMYGMSSTIVVPVTNNGNRDATVTLSIGGSAYAVISAKTFASPGGGTTASGVVTFTPAFVGPQNDVLSVSVAAGDVVCGFLPNITLAGRGI